MLDMGLNTWETGVALDPILMMSMVKHSVKRDQQWSVMLQGRTVDFKNTLIIMTSNVGSSVIEKGGGGLGFQLDTNEEDSSYNRIKTLVNEELKQYFRPEFLNRCTPMQA